MFEIFLHSAWKSSIPRTSFCVDWFTNVLTDVLSYDLIEIGVREVDLLTWNHRGETQVGPSEIPPLLSSATTFQ